MKRRGFLKGALAAAAFLSAAASGLGASVAELCSKLKPHRRAIKLPPVPKWNKATDDIDRADFARQSEAFERSLLPRDLVFPQTGQIWEAVRDCEVHVSCTMGPKGPVFSPNVLRKGERIRVLPMNDPKPLLVKFRRLAPEDAERELWMRMARTVPMCVDEPAAYFCELFRLVG